jgi:TRAP-type C4-dicarboxylate transport system permease small subunit
MLGKVLETSCNGLRVLLGCLVGALIVPVLMQVIARYTGIIPVYLWTEELSTFIFIWVVMIGSMIAVWDGLHFDVQVIPEASNRYMRLAQKSLVLGCIAFFGIYFAWYGQEYLAFGLKQHSVMMRASLAWTHISVPISGAVWAIFALYRWFEAILEFSNPNSTPVQDASS